MNQNHGNRLLRVAIVGVFGAATALAGTAAVAHDSMGSGRGPMMQTHSGGGPGARNLDPAKMQAHSNDRIKRMLGQVGASDQQISQVQGIWSAAMTDLAAMRKERVTGRQAISELLARSTIDRRALEDLRKQQQTLADRSSQRFTQAMADAAEVLDPQQRAKLAEMMKSRRDGMRGGRHGGGFGHSGLMS